MFRQYGQAKSDKEEVKIILNQINSNNLQFVSIIQIFRSSFFNNVLQDSTYLSNHITQIFPSAHPGYNTIHAIFKGNSIFQVNSIRRQVNKVVKKNGYSVFNSIDVTDTKRYFSEKGMTQLGPEGLKMLAN